jgi:hypothetical protein
MLSMLSSERRRAKFDFDTVPMVRGPAHQVRVGQGLTVPATYQLRRVDEPT